jgi:preprotein translocase subunit SecE
LGVRVPPGLPKLLQALQNGLVMKNVVQFLSEVKIELGKVVWPSIDEWIGSTIVVLFLVLISSIYLAPLDFGFSKIASYIFKSYRAY